MHIHSDKQTDKIDKEAVSKEKKKDRQTDKNTDRQT